MEGASTGRVAAGELLEQLLSGLDRLEADRSRLSPSTRLEWLRLARKARSRLDGLCAVLAAEAERTQASEAATGTPLKAWLGRTEVLSRSEASGVVHQARAVGEHPVVGAAAVAGRVNSTQARAITRLLDGLKPSLAAPQLARAEELLVGWASRLDAKQLEGAASRVLAEVAPTEADELTERRLQAEAEAGWRSRSLRFFTEGGCTRFEGSLPRLEGQAWIALINAHTEAARRTAIEARDPLAAQPTLEQRRADALISMIRSAGDAKPVFGAGTPRVIVTLDYERLQTRAAGAGVLASGQQLSAGELRRLCCDADLVPAVLGRSSEVLDVGRASRLVTPAIRTALVVRDRGCVFPGCDLPSELCEAHHIVPWWAGGVTAPSNLVLLCHSHHGVVEPARHNVRDQWEVRIAPDGLPEFIPPRRLDASRTPVRHSRHGPPGPTRGGVGGKGGDAPPATANPAGRGERASRSGSGRAAVTEPTLPMPA